MSSRRILSFFVGLLVAVVACHSDSTDPGDDGTAASVLILDDVDEESEILTGTEVGVEDVLTDAGHEVTQGGRYYNHTGTDFSDYDLVIVLNGVEYHDPMQPGVQEALLDWVSDGGTLLTTEWMTYWEGLTLIIAALPLEYENNYCDAGDGECVETYTRGVDHDITEGVPASFQTPSDWTYSFTSVHEGSTSTNLTVLFTGSTSGAAVAIGRRGSGHLVHWNMGGVLAGDDIWNDATARILSNIASFAAR